MSDQKNSYFKNNDRVTRPRNLLKSQVKMSNDRYKKQSKKQPPKEENNSYL